MLIYVDHWCLFGLLLADLVAGSLLADQNPRVSQAADCRYRKQASPTASVRVVAHRGLVGRASNLCSLRLGQRAIQQER